MQSKEPVSVPHFALTAEAARWAKGKICDEAYYHELPASLANLFNETFFALDAGRGLLKHVTLASHATLRQAGVSVDYGQLMTTYSDPQQGGAIGISFDERFFQDEGLLNDLLKRNRAAGQLTIETARGLLVHEYGHVLEHSLLDDGAALRRRILQVTNHRLANGQVSREDWLRACGKLVFGGDQAGDFLPSEAWAESFRLMHEGKLPSCLEYMRDIFKEVHLA